MHWKQTERSGDGPKHCTRASPLNNNLVWLENLNLRGDYRVRIMEWIHEKHPELDGLYHEIYSKKSRAYWTALDEQMREYTALEGMPYLRDNDQHRSEFGQPPVVVNYFYHEEVKKSAKK